MSGEDKTAHEKHDELLERMKKTKEKWDAEKDDDDEDDDDTDKLLSQAIELAIQQGKGWSPEEKEEYMAKILDDDFIPPLFASSAEEVEKSGLAEAFSSLQYDEPPCMLMKQCKQKGNDAFLNGKRNQAHNVQYYRDAINHYYQAFAWAQRIEPFNEEDNNDNASSDEDKDNPNNEKFEVEHYTEQELNELKSTLCSNAAMAHMMLKNWGYVKEQSKKAIDFNDQNIKAFYRLAKANQGLQNWEDAGNAIDAGLKVDPENKDLIKLQSLLEKRIAKARKARQQRERARAERVSKVKKVWKHCKDTGIKLGRVPLVSSVTDDDEEADDENNLEQRWHHHYPHSGRLPVQKASGECWTWPCMFVYPSHNQSDFVEFFNETDMIALRMAEMFPELEGGDETAIPWDYNNDFVCSSLAVYFEVHCTEDENEVVHPDNVSRLKDQGSAMRFYEASRALKGDEGPDMANLARAVERKALYKQRKAWKKKHGSLWSKPDACPVVRVHPASNLLDVLQHKRFVVPNFLVTFILFPEKHPAHEAYLKEHKCIDIIQPKSRE